MILNILPFPEVFFLKFHEVDADVSINCSPGPWDCRHAELWYFGFHITLAMASKQPWSQPCGLCNLGHWSCRIVYHMRIHYVDHLVARLVEECSRFDHEIISAAVTHWQAHLRPCMKVDGGHFEHFMTVDEWSHFFIGDNWTCSPFFSWKLVFLICNWKHVI